MYTSVSTILTVWIMMHTDYKSIFYYGENGKKYNPAENIFIIHHLKLKILLV